MDDGLIRRAVDVNWRHLALGHDVFEADGATFVKNEAMPRVYDANFVYNIRVTKPDEIDRLLARATTEYAHATRLTFRVGPFTPPAFEARLALDGYEPSDALVMLLDGPLLKPARGFDIRAIEEAAAWRNFAELKYVDWREQAPRRNDNPEDPTTAAALASSHRLKSPPVHYVLAYAEGQAVGYCDGWEGVDGVGQVENLFVHPAYRGRGIATALIHECVTIARRRGAGPVVIVADPTDTPKHLYAALGWRPVAICRQYGTPTISGSTTGRP